MTHLAYDAYLRLERPAHLGPLGAGRRARQPLGRIVVRPMRLTDVPAVAAVDARVYDTPWREQVFVEHLGHSRYRYWVAETSAIVSGYAGLQGAVNGHVTTVTVHPDYRRLGVAGKLMAVLAEWAAQHGVARLRLEVAMANHAARRLYAGVGFTSVGLRKDYYGVQEDAVIMERQMPDASLPAPSGDQRSKP
jgi:ribosomal-protein-alanine N-acetyltransferase